MNVREEMSAWAREVLADPMTVILDTETTGLDGYVCEIAVASVKGDFLLDTLVNPLVPVEPGAFKIHGLTEAELSAAPAFDVIWPALATILLDHRRVVVYNAKFDSGVIRREVVRLGVKPPAFDWSCAMTAYSDWLSGCYDAPYVRLNGGHRAGEDCKAVLDRLREMAGERHCF
jgi:DNA polymerase III epsilon subunit-like protein